MTMRERGLDCVEDGWGHKSVLSCPAPVNPSNVVYPSNVVWFVRPPKGLEPTTSPPDASSAGGSPRDASSTYRKMAMRCFESAEQAATKFEHQSTEQRGDSGATAQTPTFCGTSSDVTSGSKFRRSR
jgi:hypothetical protein